MKTTNLGNVAVGNFGVKRSKLPINRNIYSSCGFGEVQVGQLLQVDPDTETSFSVENMTFVEPIVAPTYGHASVKYWHYFVAMRDLFNDFDAFLSKTNIRKVGGLYVVNKLPHVRRNVLSTLLLWGCHCTIYKYRKDTNGHHIYETLKPTNLMDYLAKKDAFWNNTDNPSLGLNTQIQLRKSLKYSWVSSSSVSFIGHSDGSGPSSVSNLLGMPSAWIDLRLLIDYRDDSNGGLNFENGSMKIPLANDSLMSFVDCSAMPKSELIGASGLPSEPVIIGAHDYLIEVPNLNNNGEEQQTGWAFVFKATAFSKRIAKVLKGAEFQEDFTSGELVSLMPLFAVYKAYYESFGILLYENFENTNCKRLLNDYEQFCGGLYASDFSAGFYTDGAQNSTTWVNSPTFISFVKDMGALWVTDSQDLASAHTVSPTVSVVQTGTDPNNEAVGDIREFIRNYIVGGQESTSAVNVPEGATPISTPNNFRNMHAWIDRIMHSETDARLLQILYVSTNHETIAGKRVAQLLELAGYGDWMAHQQPRFIGYDEQTIEFSQVQSKADTLKDGTGMILGERGGVGESYKYHKQHTFTNKEMGYIITLCAVMPDSGYVQTLGQAWQCVKKYDFFNAQFDGVGEELNSIASIVCGAQCNALSDRNTNKVENVTDKSFGYAPMMTRHKFVNNIVNGMFALNSVRDNYMPYCLDRDIRLGELGVYNIVDNENHTETISTIVTFDPQEMPRAGLVWRYPTRYPWLGRLARIFAQIGDRIDDGEKIGVFNALMQGYENFNNEVDGFVLLQTVRGNEWTHKLPITDSYETQEDGNKGGIDTNISKA